MSQGQKLNNQVNQYPKKSFIGALGMVSIVKWEREGWQMRLDSWLVNPWNYSRYVCFEEYL
jgi:hypothetical protein